MTHFTRILAFALVVLAMAGTGQRAQADPPVFSAQLTPDSLGVGDVTQISFRIDSSLLVDGTLRPDATGLNFDLTLPASVTIADSNAATNCLGGTLTAPSGGTSISYSGGTLDRNSFCTLTVNLTGSAAGVFTFPEITLGSSEGNAAPSSTFDLTVLAPPVAPVATFSFVLSESAVVLGDTVTATYTMADIVDGNRIGSTGFDHVLPAGLSIASVANASTTCQATVLGSPILAAVPGTQSFSFSQSGAAFNDGFAALIDGESCTVSFDMVANAVGVYPLTPSPLTTDSTVVTGNTQTLSVSIVDTPL